MQKLKHNTHLILIIAILFVTGISFAKMFSNQNLLVSPVSAEDDEEEDKADDKEDESDNDRDEDENGKENEDKDDEENKNDNEDDQKIYRAKTTTTTRIKTQKIENEDDEEDENEAENEDENESEDDTEEEISDLGKDIQKVELKIGVLASNGVSVDAFRSSLNEIKGLLAQIRSNPQKVKNMSDVAEHKLERLEKLVGMSLKDDDEDEESVNEAAEEIQELERDINKLESQLNAAATAGTDVIAYRAMLTDAKSMLAQAREKLSVGFYIEAEALAELADKKLDRIDDAIENLFADDDDEDEDDTAEEYKNEMALFVHNLKELGEMEGGIGQQMKVVAQVQNDSEDDVEEAIKDIDNRSDFVEFLIGPKYRSVAEVKTAIVENQTRIKILTELMNQLTDPAVKLVLQDQITILNQQNANLQKIVAESESGFSLFGWLARLLL